MLLSDKRVTVNACFFHGEVENKYFTPYLIDDWYVLELLGMDKFWRLVGSLCPEGLLGVYVLKAS
jgi:hypothetical protein